MLEYGAGSVIYNPRNRFSPYTARRYNGSNTHGNPRYISLGSYSTREEAESVLIMNKSYSSADLKKVNLTFEEVFREFIRDNQHFSAPTIHQYKFIFGLLKEAHQRRYRDIVCRDMKQYMNARDNYSQRLWTKRLFIKMDQEAKLLGVPINGEASYLPNMSAKDGTVHHLPRRNAFSDSEVSQFLQHRNDPHMDLVLTLCYTGLRQGELRNLKKDHVFLDKKLLIAGSKTEAGIDRRIPIHPNIVPFIARWMPAEGDYLIPWHEQKPISSSSFERYFQKAVTPYGMGNRVPHECRHTFISKLEQQNVNDNLIRKLAGHKITDATIRVYYHPTDEELMNAVLQLWQ